MSNNTEIKVGFWGGPEYSVMTLKKLKEAHFSISFIVTSLDKPKGRNLVITESPAKIWGKKNGIPILQPENLQDENFIKTLRDYTCDVFVVMAYGRIIPEDILNIPKAGSLNIHPSLLPKFRGPCPIESAILADERETGVSVIHMDREMDHGAIVSEKKVVVDPWPPRASVLGENLVKAGADLLISILPDWIEGKIKGKEQDHGKATNTKKFKKEDGLIDLSADPYENYLKIQAYSDSISAYFFKDSKRVKITEASYKDGKLTIEKVTPEGRPVMNYTDFR